MESSMASCVLALLVAGRNRNTLDPRAASPAVVAAAPAAA